MAELRFVFRMRVFVVLKNSADDGDGVLSRRSDYSMSPPVDENFGPISAYSHLNTHTTHTLTNGITNIRHTHA